MASRSEAKVSNGRSSAAGPDVLDLLEADHRRVQQLLDDFEDSDGDEAEQIELAQQICDELRVHARVEEEIFYPAVRRTLDDDGNRLLDEARVEHSAAEELIAKVSASDPVDDLFRAQVRVLGVYVEHHIVEEESELFALVRESALDRRAIGAELQARREALLADMGLDPEVDAEADVDEVDADAYADADADGDGDAEADADAEMQAAATESGQPDAATVPPPSRRKGRGTRPTAH
jgi:hemerythrin-like domain-containing protein